MRWTLWPAVAVLLAVWAPAARAAEPGAAEAVADLSVRGCYAIASGAVALPPATAPDELDRTIAIVEAMGLKFGIAQPVFDDLGPVGQTLVARSTMGSKPVAGGHLVLTFGGAQPGCRVILLGDAGPDIADGIATALTASGWREIPGMKGTRGPLDRRALVRRDGKGQAYLLNLMTVNLPGSRLRLFTTIAAVPAYVTLPPGY